MMRQRTVIIHVVLWVFFILFVFDYHWFDDDWILALGYACLEVFTYMIIFYTNLFLVKKLIKRGALTVFLASIALIILYVTSMKISGTESILYESSTSRNLFSMLMNAILFIGLSYAFYYVQSYYRKETENLQLQLQNEKLHLNQLKARINPHFIFNTLNNLIGLIQTGSKNGIELANSLSEILRYSVDKDDRDFISLSKEINHIRSYANLVLLQEPASTMIDIYSEGIQEDDEILPFVLISFFENAIKHSDLKFKEDGYIKVEAIMDEDFEFSILNTTQLTGINKEGIGIKNIIAQLKLAYGEEYSLDTSLEGGLYSLKLIIRSTQLNQS